MTGFVSHIMFHVCFNNYIVTWEHRDHTEKYDEKKLFKIIWKEICIYSQTSGVKQLIVINRIQNKFLFT